MAKRKPAKTRAQRSAKGTTGKASNGFTDATFGFSDKANLDEGAMWSTSFAPKELTAAEEARIGALVKQAAS